MEEGVVSYNVYAKIDFEPYFAKVATVAVENTSLDTDDIWSSDASIPARTYAITAVKHDGHESFFSNTAQNNDRDHDGLTDDDEISYGTIIDNPDSDGDGLKDGEEYLHGTDPLVKDTDGDGFTDYSEVRAGSDPLDENSVPPPMAMPWLMLLGD